jgi:hypothetical protein
MLGWYSPFLAFHLPVGKENPLRGLLLQSDTTLERTGMLNVLNAPATPALVAWFYG